MHDVKSPEFLGSDYLLESDAARRLYDGVRDLPIVDAHNHADIEEIVENRPWPDIWEVEAATDHYVWEVMRKRGVDEKLISFGSRTEMWRRTVCNVVGGLVERGQVPHDVARTIVTGLSYYQPKRLFFGG